MACKIHTNVVDCSRMKVNVYDSESNNHLHVHCGIVCSLGSKFYMRVSPTDIQWITPDCGIVYAVESNVNWEII